VWFSGASVGAELCIPSRGIASVVPTVPVSTAVAPSSSCYNKCAELEGNIAVETVRIEPSESQLTSDNSGSIVTFAAM